jgi:thioesterase domain-containing protein
MEASQLDFVRPLNELGMDSLLAMELKNNLERRLAFTLPMAAFLERPSITTLAEHAAKALVDDGAADQTHSQTGETAAQIAWSPLVALQSQGEKTPLFVVHPVGGDIRCYADLGRRLGKDRPVYALRARGSEGVFEPHASMEEMAESYLEAIRQVQATGPYHFVGWSTGGIFAYELARRLFASGDKLGLLALIDTPLPSIFNKVDLNDHARFLHGLITLVERFSDTKIDVAYEQLNALTPDEQLRLMLREAKAKGAVPENASEQHVRRLVEVSRAHSHTLKDYRIQPLGHPVHLFLPEREGALEELSGQTLTEDRGWRAILGDGLILHRTPGEHFDMMTGNHAAKLAEQILEQLESR